jgi:hypothetical protein
MKASCYVAALLALVLAAPCHAQLTTASVFLDNRTDHLADVTFVELAANPTTPPQTRRVLSHQQLLTTINVPILVGGQFTVSATLFNPNVNQPSSEFARIGANSFKFVEIFGGPNWYWLRVSDFAAHVASVQLTGDAEAKKRVTAAYEQLKADVRAGTVADLPTGTMERIEAAFKVQ